MATLQAEIAKATSERQKLASELDRAVLSTFETVAKRRNGVAVAEARNGLCTICHVRLRPQVFNDEFTGLTIYTERVDAKKDRLRHVLIADQRDPDQQNTIFATEGALVSDPERHRVTLRLED